MKYLKLQFDKIAITYTYNLKFHSFIYLNAHLQSQNKVTEYYINSTVVLRNGLKISLH